MSADVTARGQRRTGGRPWPGGSGTSAGAAPRVPERAGDRFGTASRFLLLVCAATGVTSLLAAREDATGDAPVTGTALLASQGLLAVVLVGAAFVWARRGPRPPLSRSLRALALGGLAFAAGPAVAAVAAGHGGLRWNLALPVILFGVFLALPRPPLPELLRALRLALRCCMWTGLAALVVAPAWAAPALHHGAPAGRDYLGLGLHQFTGLATNPNQLAPLAAAALLVELVPVGRRGLWQPHALAAAASLLLTQSRMGWGCAAAVLLLDGTWNRTRARRAFCATLAAALGTAVALVPATQNMVARSLATGTGDLADARALAWRLAYEEFQRNPLFGYGPTLFGPAYRERVFGTADTWIGQAHNQVLSTLGDSGLIGLAGLLALFGTLALRAARTRAASAGLSWALLVVLGTACLTESPLRNLGGLSPQILVALTVWLVVTSPSTLRPHSTDMPDSPATLRP
ncbi:O-antigen ligase family protein [Streptomyces sp. NPDC050085]|uniref:O-antigen ligase family protein n=1 Tax=Streptomyces sp. NPDC050085 TaxID=3365600 RepID=UPI0037BDD784